MYSHRVDTRSLKHTSALLSHNKAAYWR